MYMAYTMLCIFCGHCSSLKPFYEVLRGVAVANVTERIYNIIL